MASCRIALFTTILAATLFVFTLQLPIGEQQSLGESLYGMTRSSRLASKSAVPGPQHQQPQISFRFNNPLFEKIKRSNGGGFVVPRPTTFIVKRGDEYSSYLAEDYYPLLTAAKRGSHRMPMRFGKKSEPLGAGRYYESGAIGGGESFSKSNILDCIATGGCAPDYYY